MSAKLWVLIIALAAACGGSGIPVDPTSTASQRWSRVLLQARPADQRPPLTPYVRHALVTSSRQRQTSPASVKHWVEVRHVLHLLSDILKRAADPGLERLSRFLDLRLIVSEVSVRDVLTEAWKEIDRLIRDGIAARAYDAVIYNSRGRRPSHRELAFIALELTAYWLTDTVADEMKTPADPTPRPETATFNPTLLPYLAVAIGIPPPEVRHRVQALTEALTH